MNRSIKIFTILKIKIHLRNTWPFTKLLCSSEFMKNLTVIILFSHLRLNTGVTAYSSPFPLCFLWFSLVTSSYQNGDLR